MKQTQQGYPAPEYDEGEPSAPYDSERDGFSHVTSSVAVKAKPAAQMLVNPNYSDDVRYQADVLGRFTGMDVESFGSSIDTLRFVQNGNVSDLRAIFLNASVNIAANLKSSEPAPMEHRLGLDIQKAVRDYTGDQDGQKMNVDSTAFSIAIVDAAVARKGETKGVPAVFMFNNSAKAPQLAQLIADFTGRNVHLFKDAQPINPLRALWQDNGRTTLMLKDIVAETTAVKPRASRRAMADRYRLEDRDAAFDHLGAAL